MRGNAGEGKGGLSVHSSGLILRILKTKNRSWFEIFPKYLKEIDVRGSVSGGGGDYTDARETIFLNLNNYTVSL